MSQILKPYEELVIASDRKIFFHVRLKLTAVYIVIIMCILLGYNTITYLDLRHDLAEAEYDVKTGIELSDFPGHAESLPSLVKKIVVEDIVILSIAAWISYLFAGYTLRPVQRSLILQKKFSENASHELRTPLAVMRSDAEVLLRNHNPSKEDVTFTLKSIVEEIDRMTVMTNDLLLLARSEHQVVAPQKSINIEEIISSIVLKMSSLARTVGVSIMLIPQKSSFIINGDIAALERVFINILQNAITHTPKDGSITVSLKEDNGYVLICIQDTGKGISSKDIPHVFERFYKGENSGGTGLGLPIVKEIIHSHGGMVSLRSNVGVGTEVIVKIPCIYISQS